MPNNVKKKRLWAATHQADSRLSITFNVALVSAVGPALLALVSAKNLQQISQTGCSAKRISAEKDKQKKERESPYNLFL